MNDDGTLDSAELAVSSEWEPEWESWDPIDNIPTPAIESGTTLQLEAIQGQKGKWLEWVGRLIEKHERLAAERECAFNQRPLDIAEYYRQRREYYINKRNKLLIEWEKGNYYFLDPAEEEKQLRELRRKELPTKELLGRKLQSKEFSSTWSTITEEVWQQK